MSHFVNITLMLVNVKSTSEFLSTYSCVVVDVDSWKTITPEFLIHTTVSVIGWLIINCTLSQQSSLFSVHSQHCRIWKQCYVLRLSEGADHNTQLSVRGFGGPTLLPAHDARRRSRQCSTGWSVNAAPTPRKSLETSAVIDLTVDDDDDSRDVKAVNCYPQQSRVTGQSAVNGGVSNPVERCYGNASSEVNLVKEEPVERCYGNASSEVNLVKEEPVETEHELAEMKRRHKLLLQGHRQLQDNIHRLLSIIFPDVDIGPVDDIKAVIVDMIQTNSSVPQ